MPKSLSVPRYRKHKPSGQAVVTLNGKDHYLGPHNSKTSIAEYDRLIAEWLAAGRRLPQDDPEQPFTVTELLAAYLEHCERHYVKNGEPTSELSCIKIALGPVRKLYGRTQARDFGPLALKACRQTMIEAGWARKSINTHVGRIRRMFKWGAENELVPGQIWTDLQSVQGLQKGRSEAVETAPVKPVPVPFVRAVESHVSRQVWAMIRLQELTGMRPGEVVILRTCDLDTRGKVWIYVPESHKTEHHGRGREIYLGPKAQEVLRPFLRTDLAAYLFSPAAALRERAAELRANRKTPVQPSQQNRRARKPKKQPGERYSTESYHRAVAAGIRKANAARREADPEAAEVPHWHPNQLRHNAGTAARKEGGLELSQLVLGHSKADVTQVYAERDRERAIAFMVQHG